MRGLYLQGVGESEFVEKIGSDGKVDSVLVGAGKFLMSCLVQTLKDCRPQFRFYLGQNAARF